MLRRSTHFAFWSIVALILVLILGCSGDKGTETEPATAPVVNTSFVTNITQTTAQCGGNVTYDGGATVINRGVCWSTNSMPTVANIKTISGSGIGTFLSSLTELSGKTTYYVRAYASNSVGVGYGDEKLFITTDSTGSVTDIDGNIYLTVKIGSQWWMAENLKVTRYANGDVLPNIKDNAAWELLSTGAYCEYDNDINYVDIYGRLYNWYAANDNRNLAPTGWHVPSDSEWQTLVDYLGGDAFAGIKMKEAGVIHWGSDNLNATNESGFTALPGGMRNNNDGGYYSIGYIANFWSSKEDINQNMTAWHRILYANSPGSPRFTNEEKHCGLSLRCVKD